MDRISCLARHLFGKPIVCSTDQGHTGLVPLTVAAESGEAASPAVHAGFLRFPPEFVFGVATSSYQIEGAVDEGGRKPSIWDDFSHTPGKTAKGATGDVACDHYHRFRQDVEVMANLGIKAYRFSVSWSRLLPDGEGTVNEEGVRFYSDLIDALIEHGIEPWITLYHWDLPLALELTFGGWLGPKERIVSAFGAYARLCFQRFGHRVKHWITLNEPWCSSVLGYGNGVHAPGRSSKPETEPYMVAHNLLLSHSEAVQIYRHEFGRQQGGVIGITLNADWRQPLDPGSEEDVQAAKHALDFTLGWFADPVFFGDYPGSMRAACGDRLPAFTPQESALLKGSSDFFGLNSYGGMLVTKNTELSTGDVSAGNTSVVMKPGMNGYFLDMAHGAKLKRDKGWEKTDMGWSIVPWGFRELLVYIHRKYAPSGGIMITENGCAHEPKDLKALDEMPGALEPKPTGSKLALASEDIGNEIVADPDRIRYLRAHLSAVHAARAKGADVRGYFLWSFMDNYEWSLGYKMRFGIVRVDFRTQKRTIKSSGKFYSDAIRTGGFDAPSIREQFGGTPF